MTNKQAEQREMFIAGKLIAWLGQQGVHLGPAASGNITRREPDVICPQSGIGIEVAAAYYNRDEAKEAWASARGNPMMRDMQPGETMRDVVQRTPILVNFDASLIAELQRTLDAHCGKQYSVQTYLLLDVAHPGAALTGANDAPRIASGLTIPPGCVFARIFLAMLGATMSQPAFFELT